MWHDAAFYAPALQEDIQAAESQLKMVFPAELKALLIETDGLFADLVTYVYSVSPQTELFNRFVEQNRVMRTTPDFAELYVPFDNIFFIGEDGGGGLFGYEIENGVCTDNIVYWEHEDDSRVVVSTNGLKGYLEYAANMYSD